MALRGPLVGLHISPAAPQYPALKHKYVAETQTLMTVANDQTAPEHIEGTTFFQEHSKRTWMSRTLRGDNLQKSCDVHSRKDCDLENPKSSTESGIATSKHTGDDHRPDSE